MSTDSPQTNASPIFSPRQRLNQGLLGSLLVGLALGGYLLVLKWRGPSEALITQTAWDREIPFEPRWMYVYVAPYAVAPILFGILRPARFAWVMKRGLLIVFISLLIFAIVPTHTVRPSESQLDGNPAASFYRQMTGIDDPPANAAPSLHVSLTCLLGIALLLDYPRWWPVIIAGVLLVWLATLFTWQHHLIDVATGALLGMVGSLPVRVQWNNGEQ
jgi:membrane-associated phospholipid phosphatase